MDIKTFWNITNEFLDLVDIVVEKNDHHRWATGIKNMLKSKVNADITYKDVMSFKSHINNGSVLDFGTGSGYMSVLLDHLGYDVKSIDINNSLEYEDSDYNRDMCLDQLHLWCLLENKYPKLSFKHYSKDIPFNNDCFNAVFAYAVLEHVSKELLPEVMKEIYRVLKPNGVLFISRLPRKFSFSEHLAKLLGFSTHEKLYKDSEATSLLKRYGFTVVESSFLEVVPAYPENITNKYYKTLSLLDKILNKTFLKYFSHHLRLVCRREL